MTDSSGAVTRYGYDSFSRLTSVTLPSGLVVQYDYDGMGHRIARRSSDGKPELTYIYDEKNRVQGVFENTYPTTRGLWLGYATSNQTADDMYDITFDLSNNDEVLKYQTYEVIRDQRGDVRRVLNDTDGSVLQAIDYDEFGNVTRDTNPGLQPFGFAGGLYDSATGLVHFGARDYDPVTGTWLQRDPILFNGGTPNLYQYALSDPINLMDPTGQIGVLSGALIGGAIALGIVATGGALAAVLPFIAGTATTTLGAAVVAGVGSAISSGIGLGIIGGGVALGGAYGAVQTFNQNFSSYDTSSTQGNSCPLSAEPPWQSSSLL